MKRALSRQSLQDAINLPQMGSLVLAAISTTEAEKPIALTLQFGLSDPIILLRELLDLAICSMDVMGSYLSNLLRHNTAIVCRPRLHKLLTTSWDIT